MGVSAALTGTTACVTGGWRGFMGVR
jgi:hypothetical protein